MLARSYGQFIELFKDIEDPRQDEKSSLSSPRSNIYGYSWSTGLPRDLARYNRFL